MKGFWTALAVAIFASGLLAGCNDTNTSIQYNTGASVTNISPNGLPAGSASFILTVNASASNGFTNQTMIQWNGQKLSPTTFVDITTVYATVPASLLNKPGTAYINTLTPQSGTGMNGLSNTLSFIIYGPPNPVPTLTSVTPDSAPACGTNCGNASVTITVAGTNFLPSSNNGGTIVTLADQLTPLAQPAALTITSYSATALKAVIPGTFLANPDTAMIQVVNPPSGLCTQPSCLPLVGGGTSQNSIAFAIGGGAPANAAIAEETPAVSADGRYVAYSAQQSQVNQILLRDTCVGVANGCTPGTRLISLAADGAPGNADSHNAVVSADGRYVAFSSAATNLVEAAPSGRQIYLRDTCIGAANTCKPSTTLISTDSEGALTGTESILPSISTSGRFVAFVAITPSLSSPATHVPAAAHPAPSSGFRQVFVRDTCLGEANCTPKTTRISMVPGEVPADGTKPAGPAISGLAKQIALADGKSATPFTPTVPVDDSVFLAIPKQQ
jgi:hypothetical protein